MKEEAEIIRSIIDEMKSRPQDFQASLEELGDVATRLETGKLGVIFKTKPSPIKVKANKPTHVKPICEHATKVFYALRIYDHVAYYHVPVYGLIAVPGDTLHKVPKYRHEGPLRILQYRDGKLIACDGDKKNVLCEGESNSIKTLAEKVIPELIGH